MDLVVLLVELTRTSNKSFGELDKELISLGYSSEEIEQAFSWVSTQWHRVDHGMTGEDAPPPVRVLSPWESTVLDPEAYSYLLRLQALGLVDEDQFERIMYRILPFRGERLGVSDIKALAGSVIFDLGVDEFENELLNMLDDGTQLT
jgi:uncharacterized protein Smg (DUF494 family)